ncbi:MAG: outer membrane protein transport protein, partial [Aquabacterium sp.]|nr:outer membrane protein transport protein [Aquabacterium sp.]
LRFDRADGTLLQSTPEHFKDSWKLAIGANYKPGGPWMWRMGLALDRSPVQDAYRTPRLPDSNRTWVAGGAQYKPNAQWRFDLGAAYIFSKQATISADGGAAAGLLDGRYDSHTVIVSGQATWAF